MEYTVCAFSLFVGDQVAQFTSPSRHGFVQWIDRKKRLVSVRYEDHKQYGYVVVNPEKLIKRKGVQGIRGISTLWPPKKLKKIYPKLPFEEKVFFHWSRGMVVEQIAEIANVTVVAVKGVLANFKRRKLIL